MSEAVNITPTREIGVGNATVTLTAVRQEQTVFGDASPNKYMTILTVRGYMPAPRTPIYKGLSNTGFEALDNKQAYIATQNTLSDNLAEYQLIVVDPTPLLHKD